MNDPPDKARLRRELIKLLRKLHQTAPEDTEGIRLTAEILGIVEQLQR